MDDLNFIPILNLSISAFTGIVVTIYLWKRNTTITKKEKLIKIYFDLNYSISKHNKYYQNKLSFEVSNSIINHIEQIPFQYEGIENSELYKKLSVNLKEIFKIKNEPKQPLKYNPIYYLRLFTINLSKKDYRKLSQTIITIKESLKEFKKLEYQYIDTFELSNLIDDDIIKTKVSCYQNKLITFEELESEIKKEFIKVYIILIEKNNAKEKLLEIDEKITDFIMEM